MTRRVRVVLGWVLAVVVAALGGTLVQVWTNAAALVALGVPVPLGERLGMLAHDLVRFAPLYAALIAAGFIVAWPVAAGLARLRPGWRSALFPLAGFTALATLLLAMQWALPITAIAAARTPLGVTLLCLAGALAGLVYVVVTRPQKSSSA
ncbi:hypothetical protein HFP89_10310 [Wenzhouxiangella sp. XN79A]|uniref:hypothetical protein n=1 Tax=Wenzhouxiangella sp. XN79A TaxID=2724193 RepID=UPI00144A6E1E|nr:hypothetical protein [Wenzhouxiangella sp. XN79A]NKI35557.1 hypothetical protein [Wenzhouxiangella sp. XN79A]